MSILTIWLLLWFGGCLLTAAIYLLAAKGYLYCFCFYIGHALSVAREEIARPIRIIRKALSRKIRLDEHERKLS